MSKDKSVVVADGITFFNPTKISKLLIPNFMKQMIIRIDNLDILVKDLRVLNLKQYTQRKITRIELVGYDSRGRKIVTASLPNLDKICSCQYVSKTSTVIFRED